MNTLHRAVCDAGHALWHVMGECLQGREHAASAYHIILMVLLLLLGASCSPCRCLLFGHETAAHHNRTSDNTFNGAKGTVGKYGAVSDSHLLKMEWQSNKPVFQINSTTRITGIRG